MKKKLIILFIISNLTFAQNKLLKSNTTIDGNTRKYEIVDDWKRFDDIFNQMHNYYSLEVKIHDNNKFVIRNSESFGFNGKDIEITLDKNLKVIEVEYSEWIDVIDAKMPTFVVEQIDLKLSKNPFKNIEGIQGQYTLKINKVDLKGNIVTRDSYKGKFKSYYNTNKNASDYLWALNQNMIRNDVIDHNGAYLHPDKMPKLRSDLKSLNSDIKREIINSGIDIPKIKVQVIITEQGKIEENTIKYITNIETDLIEKINKILIEKTNWYPGLVNDKKVKSRIPLIIVTNN